MTGPISTSPPLNQSSNRPKLESSKGKRRLPAF
jgi:hypothetical protein